MGIGMGIGMSIGMGIGIGWFGLASLSKVHYSYGIYKMEGVCMG